MFRGGKLRIGESRDSHPGVHRERYLLTQHSSPPKRMHQVFRTTFSLCCAATSPTSCPRSRAARDRLMPAPQRRDNHRRHPASRVHASRPGTATREILGKPKTKPLSRQGTEADPSMQRRPQPPRPRAALVETGRSRGLSQSVGRSVPPGGVGPAGADRKYYSRPRSGHSGKPGFMLLGALHWGPCNGRITVSVRTGGVRWGASVGGLPPI